MIKTLAFSSLQLDNRDLVREFSGEKHSTEVAWALTDLAAPGSNDNSRVYFQKNCRCCKVNQQRPAFIVNSLNKLIGLIYFLLGARLQKLDNSSHCQERASCL